MEFINTTEKIDHIKKLLTTADSIGNVGVRADYAIRALTELTDLVKQQDLRISAIERRFIQFDAGMEPLAVKR